MTRITGWLSALALLLVAYLGSTWWVGKQIETQYFNEDVWQLAVSLQEELAVKGIQANLAPVAVERGFFRSQGKFLITVSNEEGEDALLLPIVQQIDHGPFPLARLARLKLTPVLAQGQLALDLERPEPWLLEALQVPVLVELLAAVNFHFSLKFNGDLKLAVQLLPMDFKDDDVALSFSKGHFDLHMGANGGYQASQGKIDHLRAIFYNEALQESVEIFATGMEMKARGKEKNNGFRVEDLHKVASLGVKRQSSQRSDVEFTANDIVLSYHSLFDDSEKLQFILEADSKLTIGSVQLNQQPLGAMSLAATIKNINLTWLSEWAEATREQSLYASVAMHRMIQKSPEFELKELRLSNQAGDFTLGMYAQASPKEDAETVSLVGPMNFKTQLKLALDKGVVPTLFDDILLADGSTERALSQVAFEYESMIETFVELAVLAENEDNYSVDVEFLLADGATTPTLILNGEEIAEDTLLQLMFLLL